MPGQPLAPLSSALLRTAATAISDTLGAPWRLQPKQHRRQRPSPRTTLAVFCLTLITTAVCCLVWSHARLFWVDELLEYYTDTKPTAYAILLGQWHARSPWSHRPSTCSST